MGMTARPCIGCTLRFVDGQRCEILSAKLAGIKGLGLTSINFKCAKRADNFKPGQPVEFVVNLVEIDSDDDVRRFDAQTHHGYVWRRKGFQLVVLSDSTDKPMLKFTENRLRRLGTPSRQCCIHCQKPQGLMDAVKSSIGDELRPYVCRADYNGYTEKLLPCEYPDGTKGPDPAPKATDIGPTLGQEAWVF